MFEFKRSGKNYRYYVKGLFNFEKKGFFVIASIFGITLYYRVNKKVKILGKTIKK